MSSLFSDISFSKQVLSFRLKDFKFNKTLSEYNIQKDSIVYSKLVGQIRLFVKNLQGRTLSFVVYASDKTERKLKVSKIWSKTRTVRNLKFIYTIVEMSMIKIVFMCYGVIYRSIIHYI